MKLLLNRKGITPIIAVILLLMMTIAIAGLAYTWLQRMQTSIQTSSENTTTTLLAGLKVNLKIEGYNTTCYSNLVQVRIYGRNAGTESAHNVNLYTNDALTNITPNSSLNPGVTTSWGGNQGSGTILVSGDTCTNWIGKTKTFKLTSDETSAEKSFTLACTTGTCS